MLILAAGDFHGRLQPLLALVEQHRPHLVVSPGDWGDPGDVDPALFARLLDSTTVVTVSGNHDDRALLQSLRNRNGAPALLQDGAAISISDLRIGGISGIWAKSPLGSKLGRQWESAHRKDPSLTLETWLGSRPRPPYVTDENVAAAAGLFGTPNLDIFITHGCPSGLADLTPGGMHGGQRCFRRAWELVRPRLYLCGHLHRLQRSDLPEGRLVLNSGDGGAGEGWLIRWDPIRRELSEVKSVTITPETG